MGNARSRSGDSVDSIAPVDIGLRIAFVADTLSAGVGGGVVAAKHLVHALRRRGHVVTTVGADEGATERFPALRLPFTGIKDINFVLARPNQAALARIVSKAD